MYRRRLGPYKRYLSDVDVDIPRETSRRRLNVIGDIPYPSELEDDEARDPETDPSEGDINYPSELEDDEARDPERDPSEGDIPYPSELEDDEARDPETDPSEGDINYPSELEDDEARDPERDPSEDYISDSSDDDADENDIHIQYQRSTEEPFHLHIQGVLSPKVKPS
ncbi:clumping factor B-like isoform X1 [Neoarius graeffei]|uniref:clumping factor B-like isoform X1 n=1 Tax=Neoarius graeffei TaxID=443677 RepID=UPI00298C074A|nr:clumping factor B-like isoform X1 [Neoarius graeffei]